jgi:hypothetical protein
VNALANPEVGKYLSEHFVSSFQKVATFRIVNGNKQGGNVASYFCAPDGRVLHVVAGPVNATTLLREAKWVVDTVRKAIDDSKKTKTSFKAIFRRAHAARLRSEHGLIVEPVTFDAPVSKDDGPVTVRDPTGKPLVPVLPPPPINGPDVSLGKAKLAAFEAAETRSRGARRLSCKAGGRISIGNKGRVHQILAAHSMKKIELLYGTIFQNILGERVSTDPVITINSRRGRPSAVCLHCESSKAQSLRGC